VGRGIDEYDAKIGRRFKATDGQRPLSTLMEVIAGLAGF
jgi:hypothetical protein